MSSQSSPQEQQRHDDLHAAYAAWGNGTLPPGRPPASLAVRPSTRDPAAAGGNAFIITLLCLLSTPAQLTMLPVAPVALLLIATPASAEHEPGSTGPRGVPVVVSQCSLLERSSPWSYSAAATVRPHRLPAVGLSRELAGCAVAALVPLAVSA